MIYEKGQLVRGGGGGKGKLGDIQREWGADYVGFLLGCSFGFEGALRDGGLIPSHWGTGRIVPMYRTNVPLIPAGGMLNYFLFRPFSPSFPSLSMVTLVLGVSFL